MKNTLKFDRPFDCVDFELLLFKSCYKTRSENEVLKHGLTTTLSTPEYELSSYTSRLIMISRWLIMSEHFVKSDCLRLEKIETSYCNLRVKSFALFCSFLYPWVVSLRLLIKFAFHGCLQMVILTFCTLPSNCRLFKHVCIKYIHFIAWIS